MSRLLVAIVVGLSTSLAVCAEPAKSDAAGTAPLLRTASAATAGWLVVKPARADDRQIDHDLVAMLNDTHISENPAQAPHGENMTANLHHAIDYLLALPRRPAAVMINGDLAFNRGLLGDYRQFASVIKRLVEAGVPLHLTLGNHDDRQVFREALASEIEIKSPSASYHVSVVETARANFFCSTLCKKRMS